MTSSILVVFDQNREVIGTIELKKIRLVGSTPGLQVLADSFVKKNGGVAPLAWDKLKNWSNGYLRIQEMHGNG